MLNSVGQSVNSELIGPPGSNNGPGIHLNAFDSDFPALANRSGNQSQTGNFMFGTSTHKTEASFSLLNFFKNKSYYLVFQIEFYLCVYLLNSLLIQNNNFLKYKTADSL